MSIMLRRLLARVRQVYRGSAVGIPTDDACHVGHEDRDRGVDPSDPMSDEYPWELLVRYGAGRVTPAEADRVAAWSAEAPAHAKVLRQIDRMVEISRAADAAVQASDAWQRLERRIADGASETRVLHVYPPRFEASPVRPSRLVRWVGSVAAAAAVAIAVAGLWRGQSTTSPTSMREIVTSRGERFEFGLPDGSRVILGPASRLRLATSGFSRERTLWLDGEGYFAVAHDMEHPFVVRTGASATQAVGTAFAVRAYPEDSVARVVVTEGRVLLRSASGAPGSGAMLDRDDLGVMDWQGRVTIRRDVDAAKYLAWITSEVHFEGTPLSEVLRELGRVYGVDIVLGDSGMVSAPVYATFRQQAADEMANALADMLDMRVGRDDRARLQLQSKTQSQ